MYSVKALFDKREYQENSEVLLCSNADILNFLVGKPVYLNGGAFLPLSKNNDYREILLRFVLRPNSVYKYDLLSIIYYCFISSKESNIKIHSGIHGTVLMLLEIALVARYSSPELCLKLLRQWKSGWVEKVEQGGWNGFMEWAEYSIKESCISLNLLQFYPSDYRNFAQISLKKTDGPVGFYKALGKKDICAVKNFSITSQEAFDVLIESIWDDLELPVKLESSDLLINNVCNAISLRLKNINKENIAYDLVKLVKPSFEEFIAKLNTNNELNPFIEAQAQASKTKKKFF